MSQPTIISFGSINMDMVIRAPRLPRPGETVAGTTFFTAAGGKGANQAAAAAKLGAHSIMVGRIGDDSFGKDAHKALQSAGVDTSYIQTDSTTSTGVALITVDENGENIITIARGANGKINHEDVSRLRSLLPQAHALLLQLECDIEYVTAAARAAFDAHVDVIFDPAPACDAVTDELISLSTVITPNTTEAGILVGRDIATRSDAEAAAKELCARGATHAVVKLGGDGAIWCHNGTCTNIPAFPVQAIDSVAAGDAFAAALAVARTEGKDMPDALTFASAAGALKVTKRGAQPGLPLRAEVDAFLAGQ
jgi:ribokinase